MTAFHAIGAILSHIGGLQLAGLALLLIPLSVLFPPRLSAAVFTFAVFVAGTALPMIGAGA